MSKNTIDDLPTMKKEIVLVLDALIHKHMKNVSSDEEAALISSLSFVCAIITDPKRDRAVEALHKVVREMSLYVMAAAGEDIESLIAHALSKVVGMMKEGGFLKPTENENKEIDEFESKRPGMKRGIVIPGGFGNNERN